MTNQEAINIMRELQSIIVSPHKKDRETIGALQMGIDALNNPGWISVKDRLPEEDTDVLVWNYLGMEIAAYTTNPIKQWYGYSGQEVFVKYWMPLPEPPKEET